MKIIFQSLDHTVTPKNPFTTPDFVNHMDEFIKVATDIKAKVKELLGNYTNLGIVGIGGSQVQPYILTPHSTKAITHLEVPDPYVLKDFIKNDPSNTRVLYLSRSGTTKEVLSFVPFLSHFKSLVVTNGGNLKKISEELNIPVIPVSFDVSGRYSIQNELGIIPMIAMGIDPVEFLTSLKQGYKKFFESNSLAEQVAFLIYELESKKISKMRILTSGSYPEGLGILFTQLINESVPKHKDDVIDASLHIMPRSAHSDVQRWYGGKEDSFVFSIRCEQYSSDSFPENLTSIKALVPSLTLPAGNHLNITSKAVEDTFPGKVIKVILENDSISELANCVSFLHAVTVKLCQIKGSDPFNQPAVQQYKNRASEIYKAI